MSAYEPFGGALPGAVDAGAGDGADAGILEAGLDTAEFGPLDVGVAGREPTLVDNAGIGFGFVILWMGFTSLSSAFLFKLLAFDTDVEPAYVGATAGFDTGFVFATVEGTAVF